MTVAAGFRRSESVMGTGATVELHEPVPRCGADRLADRVFNWLHEVDRRFSTYRPDSEINRLHRGDVAIAACSADVREVLDRCAQLWRDTDGYFDVYATGRLDPSGYVKGWAVKVASELLTAAGAVNHVVDAGGDIQTCGRPAGRAAWAVGIRHPWQADLVCGVVEGTDLAIATSGTYERGRHVVDPRTGRAADGFRSITVVGPDLGVADAYATAAMAMGSAAHSWLAGLTGYEALVVTEDGRCYRSDGFPLTAEPDAALSPS